MHSILLSTDVYKMGHMEQYAPGTEFVYSYLEARSLKNWNKTVFFGLQYYLQEYLSEIIWEDDVFEFLTARKAILGIKNSDEIVAKMNALSDLGYWPLRIKAVPEGLVVPNRNVLMTIENTVPGFHWCVGFIESLLLKVWYPCTVATCCYHYRELVKKYYEETVDFKDLKHNPQLFDIPSYYKKALNDAVKFQVHDFGYRGDTSEESAAISGAAHLVSFLGSDCVPALPFIIEHYGMDQVPSNFDPAKNKWDEIFLNGIMKSVPASEHSVMCSFGPDHEFEAFENMLTLYPEGVVSIVSDTYDVFHVLTDFVERLKSKILSRNGTTVFRPDCYDDQTEVLTNKGWVKFENLLPEHKIAQYTDEKKIQFVKPLKYFNEQYTGKMVHFTNQKGNVDLLVTPNHRMIQRHKKTKQLKIDIPINYSHSQTFQHISAGKLETGNSQRLTPIERFYIAFQADGSFNSSGSKKDVRFNFTKERKVDRLIDICIEANLDYKVSYESARPKNTQVYVTLDHIPPKTLEWVKGKLGQINYQWAEDFIEEISYWDASRRTPERFKFDSTLPINSEIVQLVAILAGYRTRYNIFQDNRSEKFSDVHSVSILKRDYIECSAIETEIIDYSGTVHCVTVPSGMLVVRRNKCVSISGNSGDPEKIICGDPNAAKGSNEYKGCLELLGEMFGFSINSKGFKVLNPKVGLIYGDGMYFQRFQTILERMKNEGWAASNLTIGVGGILRNHSRDSLGFAIKATEVVINGERKVVFKDPVTDKGKRSKRGRMQLVFDKHTDGSDTYQGSKGTFFTEDEIEKERESDVLELVFENGEVKRYQTFDEIRGLVNGD